MCLDLYQIACELHFCFSFDECRNVFPLPGLYADYVFSKEKYAPVTLSSPMFAVDCEMVISLTILKSF